MFQVHFLFLHVFNHTNACHKAHITVLSFNHLVYHKRHEFSAANDRQANIVFAAPPSIHFPAASFCCARFCREVISTYTGAYSKFCPSIIKYKPRAFYVLIFVFHTYQAHLRLWLTILLVSAANTLLPTISHRIITFYRSAALNHPNFWKNYLESADALRLITELGWPIPHLFEDTLIHAFTNLTATTPSIVEHTLCAILRALGEHLSTPLYAECCVQLCLKHTDALLAIAERQTNASIKVDNSTQLAVSAFVLNVMTNCPSFVEVIQEPDCIDCLKSNFSLTEARTSQER